MTIQQPAPPMVTLEQRLMLDCVQWGTHDQQLMAKIRAVEIGIIQSVNYTPTPTVSVRLTIKETVTINSVAKQIEIDLLGDVPLCMFRAGGFLLTLPVSPGDECIVLFTDLDYNAWWQNGGVQNRMFSRRHNLSNSLAIPMVWSQPRPVLNYSTGTAQLRSEDGTTMIEVAQGTVNVTAPTVNIGNSNVNIGDNTKIDSRVFLLHTHSGVEPGTGTSGAVV